MKAAIIENRGEPRYGDADAPTSTASNQVVVDVLAAAIHHVTRGRASGAHYSSHGDTGVIAGTDGVGRSADGSIYYFVQGPGMPGTMAEKTVIERERSLLLPPSIDPIVVAGAMNPAMASWLALRSRTAFERGQRVMILGATGASGRAAVQVAAHLGASQVIAVGRNQHKLAALPEFGATSALTFDDPHLGETTREVDVVLDFVWGQTAVNVMGSILTGRADRGRRLLWVHIGSLAGDSATIPGAFLRSANVEIVGSGFGSVSGRDMLRELPNLVTELARGTITVPIDPRPLSDVKQAWEEAPRADARVVLVP